MNPLMLHILSLLISCCCLAQNNNDEIIIDSHLDLKSAIGSAENVPDSVINDLKLVNVQYFSFDNKLHLGQILVHKDLEKDLLIIFGIIKNTNFPIAKARPVVFYQNSDSLSMLDNNTSGFNYRYVKGTKIRSAHAYGRAIDINPFQNPCIVRSNIQPTGSSYKKGAPGALADTSVVVRKFKELGWIWGGDWKTKKDYQHFEKKH